MGERWGLIDDVHAAVVVNVVSDGDVGAGRNYLLSLLYLYLLTIFT